MPTTLAAALFPPELERAWGADGETEYRQLLRVTGSARGSFFLFVIESDFSPALRDTMLNCLRDDLAANGLRLRRVALSRDYWDVLASPELETPIAADEVVVLVGLENTPGIVPEAGRKPERPAALALLNRLRETFHSRLPAPLLVWCTPSASNALQQFAPDFFDHYAGLFQFTNAIPVTLPTDASPSPNIHTVYLNETLALSDVVSLTPAQIAFYEQQLAKLSAPTPKRAHALLGLAETLYKLHGAGYVQRLQRALTAVDEALSLLAPDIDAYEWARGKNIAGIVLSELPIGDRVQNLRRAIACYEAALEAYPEAVFPLQWSMTQNNLGNAYSNLRDSNRLRNLERAIECYKSVLRVITEAQNAFDWAATQINLGTAYAQLPVKDRTESLRQAVACFEAALRVVTQAEFPYEWATVQNNLGNVYKNLLAGDRLLNIQSAIACYEAALRVRTIVDYPLDWAKTQYNVAKAQRMLGNMEAGRQAVQQSIDGFCKVGAEVEKSNAEKLLREIEDELREKIA